nr:MAG TPA: hypothetical protein [Caudoviricetes sp.]
MALSHIIVLSSIWHLSVTIALPQTYALPVTCESSLITALS